MQVAPQSEVDVVLGEQLQRHRRLTAHLFVGAHRGLVAEEQHPGLPQASARGVRGSQLLLEPLVLLGAGGHVVLRRD